MCELLVGLPEINVLGVADEAGDVLRVHIETRVVRTGCSDCGVVARVKGRPVVELVDLPAFGRKTRLVWHKRRWSCLEASCPKGSWTEKEARIGAPRLALSDRAGRWVTEQVGRRGRTVNEMAEELACDGHTVNDTVIAYGTALVDDDPDRFGVVSALGLDEVLMVKVGPRHRQEFSTQIVDVVRGQLLDVVPGRRSAGPMGWLANQGKDWRDQVRFATLDLSGPYRKVFNLMVPGAVQVADPFHVVKVRHEAPCIRRRVRDSPRWAVAAVR